MPSQAFERSSKLRWEKLQADPTCSNCGETKTVHAFERKGVDYWCIDCRREYAKNAYRKKRDAMSKAEFREYRVKLNAQQKANRRKRLASMSPQELQAHRDKVNADNLKRRDEVRDKVYEAYGGYVCNCCGVTERSFLSLDHINNDGAEHRRRHNHRTGEQMHRWIIRNNYPPIYQVLCMNCQWGKRNNDGVCPHQKKV